MGQAAHVSDFGLSDIADTEKLIAPHILTTPIRTWHSETLDVRLGKQTDVVLKLELFQVTGTFKVRGVFSVLLTMPNTQRQRGVTAVSSGNHAVAVAYAARAFGISAKVVMVATASPMRVALARAYGAEVVLAGSGPEAFAISEKIASDEGRTLIHPFEGRSTSLGTATLGLEFSRQAGPFDAIIVAVGGGGLASGLAAAVKLTDPNCAVYGVEPVGADTMHRSFVKNSPQRVEKTSTIADSLAPPMALPYSFDLCRAYIDRIVLVDDDQICEAMSVLFQDAKLAVEPAGAAATAALLGPLRDELIGKRVGVIVCGSNIDIDRFADYVRRGSSKESNA
jgi:threonine dehydratase